VLHPGCNRIGLSWNWFASSCNWFASGCNCFVSSCNQFIQLQLIYSPSCNQCSISVATFVQIMQLVRRMCVCVYTHIHSVLNYIHAMPWNNAQYQPSRPAVVLLLQFPQKKKERKKTQQPASVQVPAHS
jgi:hypothetical protein